MRAHGHARVNSRRPEAAGICDRCGRLFTHSTLRWQWDWSGERLINKRILVCDTGCEDVPQEQLRARILSPDPIPILNARPEPFTTTGVSYDESNVIFAANGAVQIVCADGATGIVMANNPTGN